MSATYNLFTRWKKHKGFKSDRQAALALGVSAQAVNVWKGDRNGDAEFIVRMSKDLGENPTKTVLEAYAEQAKGESARVLVKLSQQFGAIVIACVLALLPIAPRSVQAGTSHIPVENVYYVK